MESTEPLTSWIDRCGQLYSLPGVAVKVLDLTADPRVDAERLTRCIEQDPALTGKILRVVNSSMFGLGTRVSSLNQAVALLGIKPLKLLVLGFSLPPELTEDLADDALHRYWLTALTRALAAREICHRARKLRLPADEAFLSGLLTDVGQLALFQQLGREYVTLVRMAHRNGVSLVSAEQQSLGFDHLQLSAGLLRQWKLPDLLSDTVAALSADAPPNRADASVDLVHVVYIADRLAAVLVGRRAEELETVLTLCARYFQWTAEQVDELATGLEESIEQLAGGLLLELPQGLNYRDVLDEAHRQLVEAATQTAGDSVRRNAEQEILDQVRSLSDSVRKRTQFVHRGDVPEPIGATGRIMPPTAPHKRPATQAAPVRSSAPIVETPPEPVATDNDPGFMGRLMTAVIACRRARRSLSLLVVSVDDWGEMVFSHGPDGAEKSLRLVEAACRAVDHPHAVSSAVGEARLAVILPLCDRLEAAALGNTLLRRIREAKHLAPATEMSVSVGVATVPLPPRNFSPQDLLDSADRCLHAAQLAGGDSLKSIEIY